MSITLSGLILGLALGRVLGGVVSNFASWRYTYWLAVGLQGSEFAFELFCFPLFSCRAKEAHERHCTGKAMKANRVQAL